MDSSGLLEVSGMKIFGKEWCETCGCHKWDALSWRSLSGRTDIGGLLSGDVGGYSSRICLLNLLAIGLWEVGNEGQVDRKTC